MEQLAPPVDLTLLRRKVAKETIAAAHRGEITTIESLDPRETSIETVQYIRSILRAQRGIVLQREGNQLQDL